jgi:two-component system phosphate regulon sensor histidine kinase PhoR
VLTANSAARKLLELNGTLVGWPLSVGLRPGPLASLWSEAVANQRGDVRRDIVLDTGGSRRTVDVAVTRVTDANSPIAWLLCLRDVTEQARSAAMKADFVANASHELRTPVAAIRAAVETLAGEGLDLATRRRFMDMIDRNALRLADLTENLMHLNRVESASAELKFSATPVKELFAALRQSFSECLRQKQATLRTRLVETASCGGEGPDKKAEDVAGQAAGPAEWTEIVTDRRCLELILNNLVDNAVKFIGLGGWVEVRCRLDGDRAWFEVEDNGCGIPAEDLDRVFERFYQVDKSRSLNVGGTGLGLAIVKHAVHSLGGEVTIRSEVGRGTTVEIWVPHRVELGTGKRELGTGLRLGA